MMKGLGCGWSRLSACCTMPATCHGLTHMRSATMTYVYAGAADWGGKDPAKCNRGLYRLATDTGTWTTLERGLPDEVEVRCVTLHPRSLAWCSLARRPGPIAARMPATPGSGCTSQAMSRSCGRSRSIRRMRASCTLVRRIWQSIAARTVEGIGGG